MSGRAFVNPVVGRRSTRHLLGVSLLGMVAALTAMFSIAYFCANACVVYQYLTNHTQSTLGSTADSQVCIAGWHGFFGAWNSKLVGWSVDYSSMTPFKLSLFFVILGISCARSLSGGITSSEIHERFRALPFFNTLETTFIQLGLAGTIWGFLLIGWRIGGSLKGGRGTGDALEILLDAFGTALLSTFTGVVLAYIAAPLIRHLWRWLHAVHASAPELRPTIAAVSAALRANIEPTHELSNAISRAAQTLTVGKRFDDFQTSLDRSAGFLQTSHTFLGDIAGSSKAAKGELSAVVRGISGVQSTLAETNTRIGGLDSRFGEAIASIGNLVNATKAQHQLQAATNATLTTIVDALRTLPELQKVAREQADNQTAANQHARQVSEQVGRLVGTVERGLADLGAIRETVGATGAQSSAELLGRLSGITERCLSELRAIRDIVGTPGGWRIPNLPVTRLRIHGPGNREALPANGSGGSGPSAEREDHERRSRNAAVG